MLRAYKFRLYPNAEQRAAIVSTMGACRFVYNWALEQCKNAREAGEKKPSAFDLNKRLTVMKQENLWLYDHPNQSLQFAIRHMDAAYHNFFRGCAKKNGVGFPRFKSRKNPVQSYQMISGYSIDSDTNRVKLSGSDALTVDRCIRRSPVHRDGYVLRRKSGKSTYWWLKV